MKCTNATKFHRKSGGAQWRDLQFCGPFMEMFFDLGFTTDPNPFPISFNIYNRPPLV